MEPPAKLPRSRGRARWIGPPIEPATAGRIESPSLVVRRRKHYGAVELAGSRHKAFGEQVNVNDVVEVGDQAKASSPRCHPVLVQVREEGEHYFTK